MAINLRIFNIGVGCRDLETTVIFLSLLQWFHDYFLGEFPHEQFIFKVFFGYQIINSSLLGW